MEPTPTVTKKGSRRRIFGKRWIKGLFGLVVIAGFFTLGVMVGDGRIDLPRKAAVDSSLPEQLDYSEVDTVYQSLKDNYDGELTEEQLIEGLKHGLASATKDPYTVYFTPEEAKRFNEDLNNTFSGIGAQLGQDKDGNIQVIAPIDGFPAQKAGVKALDLIASINGTPTSGMSVDEAVTKIRGKAGTKVTLQLVRNRTQPVSVTITRENINLPSVKAKILDGNIGHLEITSFSNDTVALVDKALADFKAKKVNGIILDMRNNPGGLLEGSIRISDYWLDKGDLILEEKQGKNVIKSYSALGNNKAGDIPTVVLINGGSASASEIVAGALKDNKEAYVIGQKSYGKGVVQQLISFGDESQLKVTVASWYRPNGQNINKKGISPDKEVKITEIDTQAKKDPQLDAAIQYLRSQR